MIENVFNNIHIFSIVNKKFSMSIAKASQFLGIWEIFNKLPFLSFKRFLFTCTCHHCFFFKLSILKFFSPFTLMIICLQHRCDLEFLYLMKAHVNLNRLKTKLLATIIQNKLPKKSFYLQELVL